MANKKIAQFDISRKKVDDPLTLTFSQDLKRLDSFGIGMTTPMLCELLCVSKSAVERWIREKLIFPTILTTKEGIKRRKFRYKDILRGFTLKCLMSELGFRKFIGVRLLLEMTNQAITSKDEPASTINNERIDKYLMKVLNYSVEDIALMRMNNNNKKKVNKDDSIE